MARTAVTTTPEDPDSTATSDSPKLAMPRFGRQLLLIQLHRHDQRSQGEGHRDVAELHVGPGDQPRHQHAANGGRDRLDTRPTPGPPGRIGDPRAIRPR